uniref:Cuticle protein n=2 Tax=Phlebotomus papatasi TaxID=29031 RepID=A0A1B0DC04_PHLPP
VSLTICEASWGTPGSGQYHIQTDEGPERFFRYQTDNGQYRKEKRLQDGTVVGTDAWIDSLGYLRQKDYIADNQGYRILKSATVYVGRDSSIHDALKIAKKAPGVEGKKTYTEIYTTTPTTTLSPPIQSNVIGHDYPQPDTVFIRPHGDPIDYLPPVKEVHRPHPTPSHDYLPATTSKPVYGTPTTTLAPPLTDNEISTTPIAVYPSTVRTRPTYVPPIAAYPSTTPRPDFSSSLSPIGVFYSSTPPPLLPPSNDLNPPDLDFRPYIPPIDSSTARPDFIGTTFKSVSPLPGNSVQPIFDRGSVRKYVGPLSYQYYHPNIKQNQYDRRPNLIGNGYDAQYPQYDGVTLKTGEGFRYYLPRQYHEETNSGGDTRTGSFGYIDPFGIRRVIYYNTAPGRGFVHRKNNRYVGFNATPYDPRPIT